VTELAASEKTRLLGRAEAARAGHLVLLVFLLGLAVARSWTLFAPRPRLDAHREAVIPWAYRDPSLAALLRDVEPFLRFGEILWISVPPSAPRYDPGWFTVMVGYAWPYQTALRVSSSLPAKSFRRTVVVFGESGSVRILRPGRPEVGVR
jgi:hypothetical protein